MIIFFLFFLQVFNPNFGFSEFIYQDWESKIYAEGQDLGGVKLYEAVIGIGKENLDISPPIPPPLYSVKMNLILPDLKLDIFKYIQKQGKGKYQWIIAINPHGNIMPPDARKSTIKWDPETFCDIEYGNYNLKEGIGSDGKTIVEDMRQTTSIDVYGKNEIIYYTIEFIPSELVSYGFHEVKTIRLDHDETLPLLWYDDSQPAQKRYQILISNNLNFTTALINEVVVNDNILFLPAKIFTQDDIQKGVYYWKVLNFSNTKTKIITSGSFKMIYENIYEKSYIKIKNKSYHFGYIYGRISGQGVTVKGGSLQQSSIYIKSRNGWFSIILRPCYYILLYNGKRKDIKVEPFRIKRINLL